MSLRCDEVFGLPRALAAQEAIEIAQDLDHFASLAGGDLDREEGAAEYLDWLRTLTHPRKREASVREALADVAVSDRAPRHTRSHQLFHQVESRRWVPSYEGVVIRPHLGAHDVVFSHEQIAALCADALRWYRDSSTFRIDTVAALLRGDGGQMHPAPTATLLLLLLNDTTEVDRSLPRSPAKYGMPDVAEAVFIGVGRIAELLGRAEPTRDREEWTLGGYSLSEINRRLVPPGLVESRFRDLEYPKGRAVPAVHIAAERVEDAVFLLGRELATRLAPPRLREVLGRTDQLYRNEIRPMLLRADLAYGSTANTGRIIRDVTQAALRVSRVGGKIT